MIRNPALELVSGRKVVITAGTRVALGTVTQIRKIMITAEEDNTGVVVVGGSGVIAALATREGIPLWPTDTIILGVEEMGIIYLDATVSGDGITWLYNW